MCGSCSARAYHETDSHQVEGSTVWQTVFNARRPIIGRRAGLKKDAKRIRFSSKRISARDSGVLCVGQSRKARQRVLDCIDRANGILLRSAGNPDSCRSWAEIRTDSEWLVKRFLTLLPSLGSLGLCGVSRVRVSPGRRLRIPIEWHPRLDGIRIG